MYAVALAADVHVSRRLKDERGWDAEEASQPRLARQAQEPTKFKGLAFYCKPGPGGGA